MSGYLFETSNYLVWIFTISNYEAVFTYINRYTHSKKIFNALTAVVTQDRLYIFKNIGQLRLHILFM